MFNFKIRSLNTNHINLNGQLFLANSSLPAATFTTNQHDGAGNIGLSDGSVQQVTSRGLAQQIDRQGSVTNRLLLPLLP